ncbi:uncharacterized protein DS421_17g587530 [Arachis hypogaea]|nr:uncharacterized protein DS421_17g587530 [Arachis hypogaea]
MPSRFSSSTPFSYRRSRIELPPSTPLTHSPILPKTWLCLAEKVVNVIVKGGAIPSTHLLRSWNSYTRVAALLAIDPISSQPLSSILLPPTLTTSSFPSFLSELEQRCKYWVA